MRKNSSAKFTDVAVMRRRSEESAPSLKNKVTVGGASVFTLLVVMCLGVFALITVTASARELALSERSKTSTQEYYDVQYNGEKILHRIKSAHTGTLEELGKWISSNEPEVTCELNGGEMTLNFFVKSGSTVLDSTIAVTRDKKVVKLVWKTHSSDEWTTEPMSVWNGL